jgi:hypothetical protein
MKYFERIENQMKRVQIWLCCKVIKFWHNSKQQMVMQHYMSQPHFEGRVRSPLTLLKMRVWSPPGLPKTQKMIIGVKTPRIEMFIIPLERSQSVDVQNGLA